MVWLSLMLSRIGDTFRPLLMMLGILLQFLGFRSLHPPSTLHSLRTSRNSRTPVNCTMGSVTDNVTDTSTISGGTTVYTPAPSEKTEYFKERTSADLQENTSSVPQPGKTFLVRERKSGLLLTLLDGVVSLHPAGNLGSAYHWSCHERKGWLGFKSVAAGRWLGHDLANTLQATAAHHQGSESFCLRFMPKGGYVLLMKQWDQLWPVKKKQENGVQKAEAPTNHRLVWEFVAV
ncbi:hypothetical protein PMIN03_006215 [Paraphaeosphaeria minitans]